MKRYIFYEGLVIRGERVQNCLLKVEAEKVEAGKRDLKNAEILNQETLQPFQLRETDEVRIMGTSLSNYSINRYRETYVEDKKKELKQIKNFFRSWSLLQDFWRCRK